MLSVGLERIALGILFPEFGSTTLSLVEFHHQIIRFDFLEDLKHLYDNIRLHAALERHEDELC